jgi:hypothetical protein
VACRCIHTDILPLLVIVTLAAVDATTGTPADLFFMESNEENPPSAPEKNVPKTSRPSEGNTSSGLKRASDETNTFNPVTPAATIRWEPHLGGGELVAAATAAEKTPR